MNKAIVGKRMQKGFEIVFFLDGEAERRAEDGIAIEAAGHDQLGVVVIVDHFAECAHAAIMHVRCGNSYVAEAGHFELAEVGHVMGERGEAAVAMDLTIKEADTPDLIACKIRREMTLKAFRLFAEDGPPANLLFGHAIGEVLKPAVIGRVARFEGSLEGGYGVG